MRTTAQPSIHREPLSLLSTVLPVLLGGIIYILWRPQVFVFSDIIAILRLSSPVFALRAWAHPLFHLLPGWMLYSLPEGLWAFSFTYLLASIWSGTHHPARYFWVALPVASCVGGEFAQRFHIIPGTFDYMDISFSVGACIAALIARKFISLDFYGR